jgi:hypothetical protein
MQWMNASNIIYLVKSIPRLLFFSEKQVLHPTPRVQWRHPPPKIRGPPRMMEFTDDDMEEEKEELSNKLVVSLKQKITALEKQVAVLHLAVYDQHDDFGVLRKATTSKLKHFAKALGDLSLYNAPSPKGSLREVWK